MLKWFQIGESWHCGKLIPAQAHTRAEEIYISRCGENFTASFTMLAYDAPPALNGSVCKSCLETFKTLQEIMDLRIAIEKRNSNGASSGE
jgi:hypothetical protein